MTKACSILGCFFLLCLPLYGGKPGSSTVSPPSAMLFGSWTTSGPGRESFFFTPSQLTFQRSFTVPADGAWFWGEASYRNFVEMDCDHHYRADLDPATADYSPFFSAGILPPPHDICSFNNCFSCRVDWGGTKALSYLTTQSEPAYLPEGTYVVTLATLNGGGDFSSNLDNLNVYIAQENRSDLTSLSMFQAVTDDDPTPASDSEVAERYFIANSADRVPVVPVFHGSVGDFPGGPDVTYTAIWDNGTQSTGEEAMPLVVHGLTVVDVPVPKMPTGSHTFKLAAKLPGNKTLTTDPMKVFIYSQTIYVTFNALDPKTPVDDLPNFLPGSDLNGNSVDLRSGPQMVQLNILIGRGSSGTFDVHLRNVTHYPGIAMNYPKTGADTDPDMDFGAGIVDLTAIPIPKGGAPKVVKLPLYIRDYGATATIEVTVPYKKTTFTAKRRVPLDDDGNGLPDVGWTAIGGVKVDTASLSAIGDADDASGATGTEINVTGDGLSSFEEMRGYYVAGTYYRLNPRAKEVFFDIDSQFLIGSVTNITNPLNTLSPGARVLYMEPDETKGQDSLSRNLLRTHDVVSFNRDGVPHAHASPQRAVRLIYQDTFPPAVHLAGPNIDVPVWQVGFLGATLGEDVFDTDLLNAPGNVASLETPMRTQFSEEYLRTFTNLAVNTTFSYPEHYDASGNIVPQCMSANQPNCDIWDTTHNLIIPSLQEGGWVILYTVPDPAHDPVEHYSLQARSCLTNNAILGGLTTIQMETLKALIAVHEMGHAMHMDHLRSYPVDCGDLMFDTEAAAPNRKAMSNYTPQPTGFSNRDINMMRLWNP